MQLEFPFFFSNIYHCDCNEMTHNKSPMLLQGTHRNSLLHMTINWIAALFSQDLNSGWKTVNLTHWDQVMNICVSKQTIIVSDNGLSPGGCLAIIGTNAGILSIGALGTNCSEMFIEIYIFSFKKMHLKMSSLKWQPFCLGPNALTLLVVKPEYSWRNYQCHGCWCPGSCCHQDISSHGIAWAGQVLMFGEWFKLPALS